MRKTAPLELEMYRESHPLFGDSPKGAMYGYFCVRREGVLLHVVSSGAEDDWEHVSVSAVRISGGDVPTWEEMQAVKELFWEDEETVLQLHPKKSEYVNACEYCLHMWKPVGVDVPLPPRDTLV